MYKVRLTKPYYEKDLEIEMLMHTNQVFVRGWIEGEKPNGFSRIPYGQNSQTISLVPPTLDGVFANIVIPNFETIPNQFTIEDPQGSITFVYNPEADSYKPLPSQTSTNWIESIDTADPRIRVDNGDLIIEIELTFPNEVVLSVFTATQKNPQHLTQRTLTFGPKVKTQILEVSSRRIQIEVIKMALKGQINRLRITDLDSREFIEIKRGWQEPYQWGGCETRGFDFSVEILES